MRIEVVRTLDGLANLRDEWRALWHSLPDYSPYSSWEWQFAWVRAHRLERRLYVLTIRDDAGELLGVAPLQRVPIVVPGLGALTFVGQETSISPDFLVRPELEREFCLGVLEYVSGRRDIVGMVLKMAEPLRGARCLLDSELANRYGAATIQQYSQRGIVRLPLNYDDFTESLGSKMQREMRAAVRGMKKSHDLVFSCDDQTTNFDERLADLFRLNEAKWGRAGGRGHYEKLYPLLHRDGMLNVLILYVDGHAAAGLSVLLSAETVYGELAGLDFEVNRRHLGKCFYGLAIEWMIQNRYRRFDFSSGTEPYKLRFRPEMFPKYRVTITGFPVKGFLPA